VDKRSWSRRNIDELTIRPKLHYTDTGYGHTTPPTDELTTILQQICHIAMSESNISTCQDVGMWQIFVRWWCPFPLFIAGVRVVEFGSKETTTK